MTDIQININQKTFAATTDSPSRTVIADLQLVIESGEFVCLVGPSGCGKTSLLNIIAGLDQQYEGSIKLGQHQKPLPIGYVFQNPRLLPWRTVRENIELVLTDQQSPEIIDTLLAAMNLLDVQNVYPERLSLGMSRRVSMVRAFAINPDILLMDEPFVSLDPPTTRQVQALLIKLWSQRPHSVLSVTHDLREAITLADRLVFLSTSPMAVISEIPVTIPRSQRHNDTEIEKLRQQLASNYPEIKNLL